MAREYWSRYYWEGIEIPREEERIFMFMDLRSSTAIAEKLGHLKYSSFIRDCFIDINAALLPFRAEVYQYAGGEIVVTWKENEGLKNLRCLRFFFACKKIFIGRAEYYTAQYGLLSEFKARCSYRKSIGRRNWRY